jgi:hypothetical protein
VQPFPKLTYFHFNAHPHFVDACDTAIGLGIFSLGWTLDGEQPVLASTSVKVQTDPCDFPPDLQDFAQNLASYVPEEALDRHPWMPLPKTSDLLLDRNNRFQNRVVGFGLGDQFGAIDLLHDFPVCCSCLGPLTGCRLKRVRLRAVYDGRSFPTLTVESSDPRSCGGAWWTLPLTTTHNLFAVELAQPRALEPPVADEGFLTACGEEYTVAATTANFDGLGRFRCHFEWLVSVPCECERQNAPPPFEFSPFPQGMGPDGCLVHITVTYHFMVDKGQ